MLAGSTVCFPLCYCLSLLCVLVQVCGLMTWSRWRPTRLAMPSASGTRKIPRPSCTPMPPTPARGTSPRMTYGGSKDSTVTQGQGEDTRHTNRRNGIEFLCFHRAYCIPFYFGNSPLRLPCKHEISLLFCFCSVSVHPHGCMSRSGRLGSCLRGLYFKYRYVALALPVHTQSAP